MMAENGTAEPPATRIERAQIAVWRIGAGIGWAVVLTPIALALALMSGPAVARLVPFALVAALALAWIVVLPARRWRTWAYDLIDDELLTAQGSWFRMRTVVPLTRIQHIDVTQGPIERRFGLGRLTVHTAGTGSNNVQIPGLRLDDAEALRDRIRVFIRIDEL